SRALIRSAVILSARYILPGHILPGAFLELQSRRASRICESLDASVIEVSAAIENDLGDSLLFGALGYQFADLFRRGKIATDDVRLTVFGFTRFERSRRDDGYAFC